jgi:hypothetical protein
MSKTRYVMPPKKSAAKPGLCEDTRPGTWAVGTVVSHSMSAAPVWSCCWTAVADSPIVIDTLSKY